MRILVVSAYFDEHRGGVETVAGELCRRLARRGHEVTWVASAPTVVERQPGLGRVAMGTWNVMETSLGIPYPLWAPVSLWRLFREVRYSDVVHLHDTLYQGNLTAYCCARLLHKPVVVTQHIAVVPYASRALSFLMTAATRTLGALVLNGSRAVIFCSHRVCDYFSPWLSGPTVARIPNGVSHKMFSPATVEERVHLRAALGWPIDQPVLLFVGRFVEKKGLELLRQLASQFPECRWVFVGWGPLNPARWRLPNVECKGSLPQNEIVPFYRAADLLVLPSVGEGFPLVVQEAMACGTPVLISSETARGMPGVETVAFVSELTSEALRDQIQRIVTHSEALDARRVQCADFARCHWNWDRCVDAYDDLFRELHRNGHRARRCSAPAARRGPKTPTACR